MGETGVEHAREKRHEKAAALASLENGELDVLTALRTLPDALNGVRVYKVLLACPSIGETTLRQVLEDAQVWPLTQFGQLTRMQRASIIEALPARVKH